MAKILVAGARIALKPQGMWSWSPSGQDLIIELPKSDAKLSSGGLSAQLATDVLAAIKREVSGAAYHHASGTVEGKVAAVDATLDFGSEAAQITVGGQALATDATTGRFMISVGSPSVLAQPEGGRDPLPIHMGSWRVVDPKQRILSEGERRISASGSAPASRNPASIAPSPEGGGTAREFQEQDLISLHFHVALAEPGDASYAGFNMSPAVLFARWTSAVFQGDLDLDIRIAQPKKPSGGLIGRFTRQIRMSSLLHRSESGAVRCAPMPVDVILPPADLDPAAPILTSIVGRLRGSSPQALGVAQIGGTATFLVSGRPQIVITAPLPSGPAQLRLPHSDVFQTETQVYDGEKGRVERLLEVLNDPERRDGWSRLEEDPPHEGQALRRPWRKLVLARRDAFSFVETQGVGAGRRFRCEPLKIHLAPESPALLTLRAMALNLDDKTQTLQRCMDVRSDRIQLALTLSRFLRAPPKISEAARFALQKPVRAPESFTQQPEDGEGTAEVQEIASHRSRGLIQLMNAGDKISAPDLYLALHAADLREKGHALALEAGLFLKLLSDDKTRHEQELERHRLGYASMMSSAAQTDKISEEEEAWVVLAGFVLQLEPSSSVVQTSAALGADMLNMLGSVDDDIAEAHILLQHPESGPFLNGMFSAPPLFSKEYDPLANPKLEQMLEKVLVDWKTLKAIAVTAHAPALTALRTKLKADQETLNKYAGKLSLAKHLLEQRDFLISEEGGRGLDAKHFNDLSDVYLYVLKRGSSQARESLSDFAWRFMERKLPLLDGSPDPPLERTHTARTPPQDPAPNAPDASASSPPRPPPVGTGKRAARALVQGASDTASSGLAILELYQHLTDEDVRDAFLRSGKITTSIGSLIEVTVKYAGKPGIHAAYRRLGVPLTRGSARAMSATAARAIGRAVGVADILLNAYVLQKDFGEKSWGERRLDMWNLGFSIGVFALSFKLRLGAGAAWLSLTALNELGKTMIPPPDTPDVQACLSTLKAQVSASPFGQDAGAIARPALLPALAKRRQRQLAAEKEWLQDYLEARDDDEQEAMRRLSRIGSALDSSFRSVSVQRANASGEDLFLGDRADSPVRATQLTLPLFALCDDEGAISLSPDPFNLPAIKLRLGVQKIRKDMAELVCVGEGGMRLSAWSLFEAESLEEFQTAYASHRGATPADQKPQPSGVFLSMNHARGAKLCKVKISLTAVLSRGVRIILFGGSTDWRKAQVDFPGRNDLHRREERGDPVQIKILEATHGRVVIKKTS